MRQNAVVKIMLEIGEHILVKPSDAVVIFAFTPQRVVEDAEELKSLMECRGTVFRNFGENGGDFRAAFLFGGFAIAFRQIDDGIDARNGRFQKFDAHIIMLFASDGQTVNGDLTACAKPRLDGRGVVWTDVEDKAFFMEIGFGTHVLPFLFRELFGNLLDGSREGDAFIQDERGRFRRKHRFQGFRGTFCRREFSRGEIVFQMPIGIMAQDMVFVGVDVVQKCLDMWCHGRVVLFKCNYIIKGKRNGMASSVLEDGDELLVSFRTENRRRNDT